MEINLTTPALLFPAISLLLLAYTNRFLTVANLIRSLHAQYREDHSSILLGQIDNLKLRVRIIRDMQIFGVTSLLLCVVCMFLLFAGLILIAKVIFGLSLLLLIISLGLSVYEIQISIGALKIALSDMEK